MKILIPILHFSKSGGMRVLTEIANYLIKRNYQVYFVTHVSSDKPYFPTNAKVIYVNSKGINNKDEKTNLRLGLLRTVSLYNFLKKYGETFDFVIANSWKTAYAVAFAGGKNKKIYYIQAYEVEFSKNIQKKFLSKLTYALPLKQIVNSHIYVNYKNIKGKDIVYPGLDLKKYYRKKYIPFTNEIVIGAINRTEIWKGTNDVIEAYNILKKVSRKYNFKLKLAYSNELNEKIDGLEYIIPKNDSELADYYRSVDIMVAPGHIQLGAVHYPVIESMACGTPIITTGYYPADDKRNAWIVSVKSPEKIAECIMYMIENQELVHQKVEQAIQDVQQFDWNTIVEKFIKIIEES